MGETSLRHLRISRPYCRSVSALVQAGPPSAKQLRLQERGRSVTIVEIRQGGVTALGRDQKSRFFPYTLTIETKRYDLADPASLRVHWEFRAYDDQQKMTDPDQAGFRSTCVEIDTALVISIEMFADRPAFREKGLPEAIIAEMAQLTGRVVKSSSNRESRHLLRGEYRTPDADKVWRRLVAAMRATYSTEEDRYTYLP